MSNASESHQLHHVQQPGHQPERYESPSSLDEALALLDADADAQLIAGGTDLHVELDRGVSTPKTLIDLTRVAGLDSITESDGQIHLGALVTHNQAATSALVIEGGLPLAQASLEVGSPALRNRATIVGNVVTASPANDTISALRALGASVSLASVDGTRTVTLAAFHTGVRSTLRQRNEIVTGISFPRLRAGSDDCGVYVKLGLRRAQAISVVHLAIVCRADSGAPVTEARVAIGSVAPTIITVPEAEAALVSSVIAELSDETIHAVADAAQSVVDPIDDLRAPATYRTDEVEVMARRALAALRAGRHAEMHPLAPPVLGGPSVQVGVGAAVASLAAGDAIDATVNGTAVTAAQHGETLLDWLRDSVGLTGTKEGCAEGECGACTVHLGDTAVLSCLVPAGRAAGCSISTIEGLAARETPVELHPLQQAFVDNAAVQCGYCIPGFLMAGAAMDPDDDVRLGLSGNLCRCTGYYAIETAMREAAGGQA